MPPRRYYFRSKDGSTLGPVSLNVVAEMIRSDKVKANTPVSADGDDFRPMKSFPELATLLSVDVESAMSGSPDEADLQKLLEYIYGFMSTSEIGDKQAYSGYIDELDQKLALGAWLFSLPSLAYFSTQFDASTIDLYGIASQLSTVEKWRATPKT